ncbi:MAG: glycoside hydrolase [Bacteroidetes bacterium]|nr:glycoside hydrolase [Bacteroidota bacterium]
MRRHLFFPLLAVATVLSFPTRPASAQSSETSVTDALRWRLVGPYRAGRTVGAVGIPDSPGVFFIGVNNGGVFKTDDFGRTWTPIFDDQPTGSVGDLALAPSNPSIIYVGTGEGLHRPDLSIGNGVYRSDDGGNSWTHLGLADAQQIGSVVVHPTNPDLVYVAAMGHPYGPNDMRGVYRSSNGGKDWKRIFFINDRTGAASLTMDPQNPDILFADMWSHLEGPWENASWSGMHSGLFRSQDGGESWARVEGGLPDNADGLGRIGIGISNSEPNRIFAAVNARTGGGIYRSDDGGKNWKLVSDERRLWSRGDDFAEIKVHPTNPDVVFIANIASYRSDDGGVTWTSIKGAPGGDDYHRIWINPRYPDIMLFAADQGATITVTGGRTWSSWYNQPTAQLYHVTTDNEFPYNIYGGQQESGAIRIASRSNGGQISFRDWIGVGADEYAYVAPDPLNPAIVYGGRVVRHDLRTGQTQNVAPEALRSGKYRIKRTMPLLFHPADPHMLLFGTNVLFKSMDGGQSWTVISPDLSRPEPAVPPSFSFYSGEPRRLGVIYALGPSPLDKDIIWAGTDDGLVHVTRDGGATWQDVTPPQLQSWDKIAQIDAGHFDKNTAYVAVNAIRSDDPGPHIFRTHDGGASWDKIVDGLDDFGAVNVVREDPVTPGLLYAGTEQEVYYTTDDGDRWTSLRTNMPATSIRDLVVHESDLVVGTHGRSIWILDNVTPLRELPEATAAAAPWLFTPDVATRVRWNMFSDTPLPPEEPTGANPADGIEIDYLLPVDLDSVSLQIIDASGQIIRSYSSTDEAPVVDTTRLAHPTYWMRPFRRLSPDRGLHRFVWDLRVDPLPGTAPSYSIAAVAHRTPAGPLSPFVAPGVYTVRLITPGGTRERSIRVRMDPRVDASDEDIQLQTDLSMRLYDTFVTLSGTRQAIDATLASIDANLGSAGATRKAALEKDRQRFAALRGRGLPGDEDIVYGSIYAVDPSEETVVGLQQKLIYMINVLQAADVRPTIQARRAVEQLTASADMLVKRAQALLDR